MGDLDIIRISLAVRFLAATEKRKECVHSKDRSETTAIYNNSPNLSQPRIWSKRAADHEGRIEWAVSTATPSKSDTKPHSRPIESTWASRDKPYQKR